MDGHGVWRNLQCVFRAAGQACVGPESEFVYLFIEEMQAVHCKALEPVHTSIFFTSVEYYGPFMHAPPRFVRMPGVL